MKSKLRNLMTSLYLGVGTLTLLLAPSIAFAGGWTGCGVGVGGSIGSGQVYNGIGISVQGEKGDAQLFCNYQMGHFVVGAIASYGLFYGDVKDVAGIKDEWTGLVRAGLLTSKAEDNLFYLGAGGTHVSGGGNHANGYVLAVGDEWKVVGAGAPVSIDMRYTYAQLTPGDFGIPSGSGLKVNSSEFRIGLNLAFYRDSLPAPLK